MKIIINREALLESLQKIIGVVERRQKVKLKQMIAAHALQNVNMTCGHQRMLLVLL